MPALSLGALGGIALTYAICRPFFLRKGPAIVPGSETARVPELPSRRWTVRPHVSGLLETHLPSCAPGCSLGTNAGMHAAIFCIAFNRLSAEAKRLCLRKQRGIPNKPANISRETENPCNVCGGVGRTNCWTCNGRGADARTGHPCARAVPHAQGMVTPHCVRFCVCCAGSRCPGRVNFLDEAVLPQGELPVWCSYCRGGLVYCDGWVASPRTHCNPPMPADCRPVCARNIT